MSNSKFVLNLIGKFDKSVSLNPEIQITTGWSDNTFQKVKILIMVEFISWTLDTFASLFFRNTRGLKYNLNFFIKTIIHNFSITNFTFPLSQEFPTRGARPLGRSREISKGVQHLCIFERKKAFDTLIKNYKCDSDGNSKKWLLHKLQLNTNCAPPLFSFTFIWSRREINCSCQSLHCIRQCNIDVIQRI